MNSRHLLVCTLFSMAQHIWLSECTIVRTELPYFEGTTELTGYFVYDNSNNVPVPVIVLIPDRDGISDFEREMADKILESHRFATFVADIYGVSPVPEDEVELQLLYTSFVSNVTYFVDRIQTAVEYVKSQPAVDSENIALMGFGFGGTGVLDYALSGLDSAKAVFSFHGGLDFVESNTSNTVHPTVVAFSPALDDSSEAILGLQQGLDDAGATWEITRFGGIEHGFTNLHDPRYNAWAYERSWEATMDILHEVFVSGVTSTDHTLASIDFTSAPYSSSMIDYTDPFDGEGLSGYLVYQQNAETPLLDIVLIIHDWDGLNDYEKNRANLFAEMGYAAFAADIYGADWNGNSFADFATAAGMYRGYTPLFMSRIQSALDAARNVTGVTSQESKVVIIGYCFGGTGVIDAYIDGSMDITAYVSHHGGLSGRLTAGASNPLSGPILLASGGQDESATDIKLLEEEFTEASAQYELTRYGSGIGHAFTHWGGRNYNNRVDQRSWDAAIQFFERYLIDTNHAGQTMSPTTFSTASPTTFPTASPTTFPTDLNPIMSTTTPTLAPTIAPSSVPTSSPSSMMFSNTVAPTETTASPTPVVATPTSTSSSCLCITSAFTLSFIGLHLALL